MSGGASRPWAWLLRIAAAVAVAALAAALAIAPGAARTARPAPQRSVGALCGAPGAPKPVRHVVWIVLENHSTDQLIGEPGSVPDRHMPYLNAVARHCGVALDYHAVTHPSLPNYIAMTSGSPQGITRDCHSCSTRASSIFGRVSRAGGSWRAFEESMPGRCDEDDSGLYAKRHNPAAYYTRLRPDCGRLDVALGTLDRGPLHRAISRRRLPSFTFITPNLCHDMHSCPPTSADAWLASWLPRIAATPDYGRGRTVIFILTDEGGHHGQAGQHCLSSDAPTCIVPLVVVSRSTRPGTVSRLHFSHYSLLRTTQRLLHAGPLLGHAADSTRSLARAFHLG